MSYHSFVKEVIDSQSNLFTSVSDQIWDFAEIRFEEEQSAELTAKTLEDLGFVVEQEAGGVKTAIVGEAGKGGPVIAILGEYDALPGLSQKAGSATHEPLQPGGHGHGCGHNLLGTASVAAAYAIKKYLEENNMEGTVRYYGCPAEESGSGKTHMVKAGLFDDVDTALTWHPWDVNGLLHAGMLANNSIYFKFKGASSHAAADPHLGRSALDAVDLMSVGVNFLREHVIQEARMHYAITNSGGNAPNVVQNEAEVLYLLRAPESSQVKEITERVIKIAEGAALMTETEFEMEFDGAAANLIPNTTLASLLHENFEKIGTHSFTEEENQFAKEIQQSFNEEVDEPFQEELQPFKEEPGFLSGSTDVGDVSWVVPTAQVLTVTKAKGTPGHSWQLVAQGKSSIAHKGMLLAGKVMAASAIDLFLNPDKIEAAKEEHKERLNGQTYETLMPDGVEPKPAK